MKFAFSSTMCPQWDFQTLASQAAAMQYAGVELHASVRESDQTAANLFLTDSVKVVGIFADAGVQIACVTSSATKSGDAQADTLAADECRRLIDIAANLNCRLVKIQDSPIRAGESRGDAGQALGDWLSPLGDYAAQCEVSIVLENARGFRSAREMWAILDRLSHPSIGCCWNVLNARIVGESPFVSVPTLSSRIEYARVADARLGPPIEYCALGQGDVPVEKFITRLRGIGYQDWVTYCGAEAYIADAVAKLIAWLRPKSRATAHSTKV